VKLPHYIAIDGPIGAGKTTLAQKLAEDFQGRTILERPDRNPFLADFYEDRSRHAFKTQLFFLLSRYQQQKELAQGDLFSQMTVCDYHFAKDWVFATLNLSPDEISLYKTIYHLLVESVPKPDLTIYLQASSKILLKHIKKRKIPYEKNIEGHYLEKLSEAYRQFFFNYNDTPLLVVNCTNIDFVENKADYEKLKKEILAYKIGEKHYLNIG
jgi:deoxyguanosine kinase